MLSIGASSASAELEPTFRAETIDRVLDLLVKNYVFPEVAKQMEAAVRKRQAAGEYDMVTNGNALAQLLTEHLREVCEDLHLRVGYSSERIPERGPSGPTPEQEEAQRARAARRNHGFVHVERLAGNIGYLRLDGFSGATEEAKVTATAAMTFLANTDSIIFDLRQNGGGDPDMVAHISSYLFGDDPVHLNSLYFRPADETTDYWTDPDVPGERNPDAEVYVLTSERTFSAAEEFTYNLQSLERATIVGETTGGGAHPGGSRRVNDHFTVWTPTGRAINPITGTNWEGKGVVPGVPTPVDEARHEAYILALEHAMERADPSHVSEIRDALRATHRELADIQIEKEDLD